MEQRKRIAYLIAAHSDPLHLQRLVGALDVDADFFIHIDKKQPITPFTELINKPNVTFLADSNRVKVYWGGFSQVQATLNLLEACLAAIDRLQVAYTKIVFMSGADYPIKSNDYIHRFFEEHPDTNFIRGMNITRANTVKYNYCIRNYLFFNFQFRSALLTRVTRKFLNVTANWFARKPNYIETKPGNRMDIFHGSSWWALNSDVVQHILTQADRHNEVRGYFKLSLASDEKFFHTFFFNSVYTASNGKGGEEPYVPHTSAFANLHLIDPSLQKWFGPEDFDAIRTSDKLFVRKVSSRKSAALLDRIDRELLRQKTSTR